VRLRAPWKHVSGKAELPSCGYKVPFTITVEMKLPVERAEWDEVVVFAWAKPWQTVPAMYVSSVALTQRAIGIVNTCLRNEAEYRVTSWREAYRDREYQWRDESSRDFAADASAIMGVNARSVVATRDRAKPMRSGS